jgi:hypothetical protein
MKLVAIRFVFVSTQQHCRSSFKSKVSDCCLSSFIPFSHQTLSLVSRSISTASSDISDATLDLVKPTTPAAPAVVDTTAATTTTTTTTTTAAATTTTNTTAEPKKQFLDDSDDDDNDHDDHDGESKETSPFSFVLTCSSLSSFCFQTAPMTNRAALLACLRPCLMRRNRALSIRVCCVTSSHIQTTPFRPICYKNIASYSFF